MPVVLRVVLLQLLQLLFAGLQDHVVHWFEEGIVEPGIWYGFLVAAEHSDFIAVGVVAGFADDIAVVVEVHGEDGVKVVEVIGCELSAPQVGNIYPMTMAYFDSSMVGRVAYVPVAGAGGVYFPVQPVLLCEMSHDAFCQW